MQGVILSERQNIARKIAADLEPLFYGGSITGNVELFVADDSSMINLTVKTIPVGGQHIRIITKQIEDAFLSNCNKK